MRRALFVLAAVARLAQEMLHWGLLERVGSDYRLGLNVSRLQVIER